MKFKKTRIAVSALCGVLCLLLVALWASSYWWSYTLTAHDGRCETGFGIENGGLGAAYCKVPKLSRLRFFGHINSVTSGSDLQSHWGFYIGPHPADSDFMLVVIPLWLFVLLAITTAGLYWRDNFPWRFTLRTLLIATTAVAVALWFIVWMA